MNTVGSAWLYARPDDAADGVPLPSDTDHMSPCAFAGDAAASAMVNPRHALTFTTTPSSHFHTNGIE